MNRTLGNWWQFALLTPVVVCLLTGGCQWGLIKSSGSVSVFPSDARAWPPPAPPVEPRVADAPPSGFSGAEIPAIAATAGSKKSKAPQTPQGPKPYSLEECRYLTLRNNPDLQVEAWEQAAKKAFAESSKWKIYPRPGLAAELSNRDNLLYLYRYGHRHARVVVPSEVRHMAVFPGTQVEPHGRASGLLPGEQSM